MMNNEKEEVQNGELS